MNSLRFFREKTRLQRTKIVAPFWTQVSSKLKSCVTHDDAGILLTILIKRGTKNGSDGIEYPDLPPAALTHAMCEIKTGEVSDIWKLPAIWKSEQFCDHLLEANLFFLIKVVNPNWLYRTYSWCILSHYANLTEKKTLPAAGSHEKGSRAAATTTTSEKESDFYREPD